MEKSGLQRNSALLHAIILIAICLPYCINIGHSSIWDANEAFYAETPREMLASGDYLAPHFNFQPRTQKPPLTYWIILASYRIFGVSEFAVRLPSALAAIGILLFSYAMAKLLFGPRAALLSAIITGTTARIFILARRLPIDILLLFFLTGTLFFIVRAIQKDQRRCWAPAYIFASLGFLTKGPVALLIPALTYALWVLWGGARVSGNTRLRQFFNAGPVMGAAICAFLVLPWYVLIYQAHGWMYISPFFLRDNLGRFAAESLGPSRSPLYYVSVFATDFFPWSFLVPAAALSLWHIRRDQPLKSVSFGLPVIWCALIFVLFSLSKNKQEYYIAPVYPIAAVILSGIIDRIAATRDLRDFSISGIKQVRQIQWTWVYSFIAVLLLLLSVFLPQVLSSFMPGISPVLHYGPSLVLATGVLLLVVGIVRNKQLWCFSAVAAPLTVIYIICALLYLPAIEPFRPVKSFCRRIEAESRGNDEAGYFGTALPSMAYYLRRPIFEEYGPEQMTERLRSEKRVFCILSRKDFGYFADNKSLKLSILERHSRFAVRLGTVMNSGYFPGEELLLISNRPCTETGSGGSDPKI